MPDLARESTAAGPPADTPSPSWEDAPAFREVFLVYFPPEAADSFRQAGARLYEAALEAGIDQVAPDRYVECHIRALADDLRFTALVLASTAGAREDAHLEAGEHRLASRCRSWVDSVTEIVTEIEVELEDLEPAEEAARLLRLSDGVRRLLEEAGKLPDSAADGAVGQLAGHLRDALDGLEAEPG